MSHPVAPVAEAESNDSSCHSPPATSRNSTESHASSEPSGVAAVVRGIMKRQDSQLTPNRVSGADLVITENLILEARPAGLPPKDPAEEKRQKAMYEQMIADAKRKEALRIKRSSGVPVEDGGTLTPQSSPALVSNTVAASPTVGGAGAAAAAAAFASQESATDNGNPCAEDWVDVSEETQSVSNSDHDSAVNTTASETSEAIGSQMSDIASPERAPGMIVDQLVLERRPSFLPPKNPAEDKKQKAMYEQMQAEMRKREEIARKDREKREKELNELLNKWNLEILPKWKEVRESKKVRELVLLGIPPAIRTRAWPLAAGNSLHVTRELFEIFLQRAEERIQSGEGSTDSSKMRGTQTDISASTELGDPDLPGSPAPGKSSTTSKYDFFGKMKMMKAVSREDSVHLIHLDVSRTFPQLGLFQPGGPYNDRLCSVLEAYTCYRPDLGYIQGMSFVVSMLLLNLDDVDAFIVFANLMVNPLHMAFYKMERSTIVPYLNVLDALLKEHLPKVHKHIHAMNIEHDLYFVDWILTIYSKAVPLEVACHIWDVFLFEGDSFLFRVALGIFKMFEKRILKMDFEETVSFVRTLPPGITGKDLIASAMSIPMTQKSYTDLCNSLID